MEGSVDRISSLPDSILAHILSFLPTNLAVSTSILLTRSRWTDIFPSFNNLDFDESFVNHRNATSIFVNFVDRCIMIKNGTRIDKFRLKCSNDVDTSRIDSWISAALCCKVRELDLCIGRRKLGEEYSPVFTCSTLVVLKLGIGISLNVTASVYFPCLKILHLESVGLAHNDSPIQRLVSSSPVLEDILIVGCYMEYEPVLSLSSPSLKRLTIDKPYGDCLYNLVLDMPSLVYLRFALCTVKGHILKNLPSLCEAHICIPYRLEGGIAHHELHEGIGNVQTLYLSGYVTEFLRKTLDGIEELPLLKNLTRLVLMDRPYLEMSVVMKLLQCCPNLEEFVSEGSIHGEYDEPFVPYRLKSIECELLYIGGSSQHKDVEPLEYFLKNANMLEKMQLHITSYCSATHRDVIEKLETMMVTLNKLAKAPSRSKICEVNVSFQR